MSLSPHNRLQSFKFWRLSILVTSAITMQLQPGLEAAIPCFTLILQWNGSKYCMRPQWVLALQHIPEIFLLCIPPTPHPSPDYTKRKFAFYWKIVLVLVDIKKHKDMNRFFRKFTLLWVLFGQIKRFIFLWWYWFCFCIRPYYILI